jgi:hypothetical protein
MITTVVPARSESNKLSSARRAQAWRRLVKPFPLAGEWRNPTPIGRSIGAWLTPAGTILERVRARNGRSTVQSHGAPWNGNDDSLTLIDFVLIAGLFLTTAFFCPAMAWILLLS